MVQRKPKILEEAMKTVIHTPNSSEKSTTTTTDGGQSETRDSLYFPGCRRDANCNCLICIASINATLDLMPQSAHGSSRTNFSTSRRKLPRSPVSFTSPADLSTPKSTARITRVTSSPLSLSTGSTNSEENVKRGKRGVNSRVFILRLLLGLIMVFVVEYGFSTLIPRVLNPKLSPDIFQILREKLSQIEGLNAKFSFLENELEAFVGKKVSSCSSDYSFWKVNQDGLLLHSRCTLYKSMAEEVSIWGWPLQTAGILTSEGSAKSYSIMSGSVVEVNLRHSASWIVHYHIGLLLAAFLFCGGDDLLSCHLVVQWTSPEANYVVRNGNDSWTQGKWSSLLVQLDANTWIFEYRWSFLLDKAGPVSGAAEFLKLRLTRMSERFLQGLWLLSSSMPEFITGGSIATPT